ncbi:cycloartenol synthase-like protein [Tanacetum coccineum]
MWKLKLSKGDDDPSVKSINNHIGRQFWEFDPCEGTPEERFQIEFMQKEFSKNRLHVKHSSDLLMRFQNKVEMKTSLVQEVKDDDEVVVKASLKKALRFYSTLQGEDGSWPADYGGPLFLLPGLLRLLEDMIDIWGPKYINTNVDV